jgi:NTP pyrophosphatase (non-canonical NTP hydrolase)
MFRGRLHSVHDCSDDAGIVWLQPEPQEPGECVGVFGKSLVLQEASPVTHTDFIPKRTRSEIDARIDELRRLRDEARSATFEVNGVFSTIDQRIKELVGEREAAMDDIFSAIVESHKVLCRIKQMGEKEAYGQNPAFYYAAAVSAEAGECLNKMVKALRNGGNADQQLLGAVVSELPDVVIYSFILAYVLDMDLTKLVTEKAHIVVDRAVAGYYGGPLVRNNADATDTNTRPDPAISGLRKDCPV